MSAAPPIVVESLDHHYGRGALRRQILFDVSATIPAGEIIIVTGPSGSGKTTLLTLIGALRAAQAGSVRILGEELCGANKATLEKVRRRIGFIFQQHNLLAALTATENVELGLRATGRHARGELGGALACEDEVRVAVHETGHHGPPAHIDALVSSGRPPRYTHPRDPPVLDHERGVTQDPQRAAVTERRVVGDQFADVGDERRGHDVGSSALALSRIGMRTPRSSATSSARS